MVYENRTEKAPSADRPEITGRGGSREHDRTVVMKHGVPSGFGGAGHVIYPEMPYSRFWILDHRAGVPEVAIRLERQHLVERQARGVIQGRFRGWRRRWYVWVQSRGAVTLRCAAPWIRGHDFAPACLQPTARFAFGAGGRLRRLLRRERKATAPACVSTAVWNWGGWPRPSIRFMVLALVNYQEQGYETLSPLSRAMFR